MRVKRKLQGLDTCYYCEFFFMCGGRKVSNKLPSTFSSMEDESKKDLFKCQRDGESGKNFGAATQKTSRNGLLLSFFSVSVSQFQIRDTFLLIIMTPHRLSLLFFPKKPLEKSVGKVFFLQKGNEEKNSRVLWSPFAAAALHNRTYYILALIHCRGPHFYSRIIHPVTVNPSQSSQRI